MNWTNKFTETGAEYQEDEVGNIVQHEGGVVSKACQKCKKPFKPELVKVELIQPVPMYKCEECKFENSGGDATLDHKLETNHKIKKTTKSRIVGYENKIQGFTSNITKTNNDVIILCRDCVGV